MVSYFYVYTRKPYVYVAEFKNIYLAQKHIQSTKKTLINNKKCMNSTDWVYGLTTSGVVLYKIHNNSSAIYINLGIELQKWQWQTEFTFNGEYEK